MKIFYYISCALLLLSCSCSYLRERDIRNAITPNSNAPNANVSNSNVPNSNVPTTPVADKSTRGFFNNLPAKIPMEQYETLPTISLLIAFYTVQLPKYISPIFFSILTYVISTEIGVYLGIVKRPFKNNRTVSFGRWAVGPLTWITELVILLFVKAKEKNCIPGAEFLFAFFFLQSIFYLTVHLPCCHKDGK